MEKVVADGDRDYWMTSVEALGYGAIDEIITKEKK
jgi:ATP-dependent Clp protease protease subunit